VAPIGGSPRSWLFCGSDRGGQRAAVIYSLIVTARMNDVDPQTWLAEVLARIAKHPARRLYDLLPWHWAKSAAYSGRSGRLSHAPVGCSDHRGPRRMLTGMGGLLSCHAHPHTEIPTVPRATP